VRILSIDSGIQYSILNNNQVRASGDETRTELISVRHPAIHRPDAHAGGDGRSIVSPHGGTALFVILQISRRRATPPPPSSPVCRARPSGMTRARSLERLVVAEALVRGTRTPPNLKTTFTVRMVKDGVDGQLRLNHPIWPSRSTGACPEHKNIMANERIIVRSALRPVFIVLAVLTSDLI
jgi:hypothetical protein